MESHKKSGSRKKAGSHRRLDEHGLRDKDRIGLMALISSQNAEFLDLSKPYVLTKGNLYDEHSCKKELVKQSVLHLRRSG